MNKERCAGHGYSAIQESVIETEKAIKNMLDAIQHGHDERGTCPLMKKTYKADYGQQQYKHTLRDARVG